MATGWRGARTVLLVWGAISAVALLAIIALLGYQLTPKRDPAGRNDVRFVLNWSHLGEERLEAVVHSYESARSITGDHFDAYAIRVASLTDSELANAPPQGVNEWVRGDRVDPLVVDAVALLAAGRTEAPWLPDKEELLSDRCYVWVWRIELRGRTHITAAAVIFAQPSSRMVYYASLQS